MASSSSISLSMDVKDNNEDNNKEESQPSGVEEKQEMSDKAQPLKEETTKEEEKKVVEPPVQKKPLKTCKSSISWESVEDDIDYDDNEGDEDDVDEEAGDGRAQNKKRADNDTHQYRLLTSMQCSSGQCVVVTDEGEGHPPAHAVK